MIRLIEILSAAILQIDLYQIFHTYRSEASHDPSADDGVFLQWPFLGPTNNTRFLRPIIAEDMVYILTSD